MDVVVADAVVSTDIVVGRKTKRWEDEPKRHGTTPIAWRDFGCGGGELMRRNLGGASE